MDATENWIEQCLNESDEPDGSSDAFREGDSLPRERDRKPDDEKENTRALKPHSTPLTLQWLEENYEMAEGVCIPRSALYMHYLDFCEKHDIQPVNAASFGKIIRQQFPQLTTRRLGTRGQSKYHYYGIAVRESSLYYDIIYSKKGAGGYEMGDPAKKEASKQTVAYSPRSKLGTLLPEFPDVKDLNLPSSIPQEKVSTFIMMYRTHCQRILDTVIRANFDEVQSFLLHFWQGMPPHMVSVIGSQTVVNIVGVCDSILYKAISSVLMPTVLQALPDSLTQVIRKFAKQLDEWLRVALEDLPDSLCQMKFDLARRFSQMLRRQTSLNHLCQASRTVIHSSDITSQMLEDWRAIDIISIVKQTLYTMENGREQEFTLIQKLYKEFETLLEEQAPIEAYTEWLDQLVDRCVVKLSSHKPGSLRRIARQFLLMWSGFGTRVIRDMTLHSSPSFGSFHLLHLMFDDYVMYLVESLQAGEHSSQLLQDMKGEKKSASKDLDDPALPNIQSSMVGMETNPQLSVILDRQPSSPNMDGSPLQSPTGSHNSTLRTSPYHSPTGMVSANSALHTRHAGMNAGSVQVAGVNSNPMASLYPGQEDVCSRSAASQATFHYSSFGAVGQPGYSAASNEHVSGVQNSAFRFSGGYPSSPQYHNGRLGPSDNETTCSSSVPSLGATSRWPDVPSSSYTANPDLPNQYSCSETAVYGSAMNLSRRGMEYNQSGYQYAGTDSRLGHPTNGYVSYPLAYGAEAYYHGNKRTEDGGAKRRAEEQDILGEESGDHSTVIKSPQKRSSYSQHLGYYSHMQTAS
ncbi:transcription factor RFX4-like isoform X2 [Branchiostoma lanceolatum]|uniref:transcription factor RFX4-like isoform X2 n=1 Tax=Branchiostoma lanceolatum TaxID=7740 RepID=UPI003451DC06